MCCTVQRVVGGMYFAKFERHFQPAGAPSTSQRLHNPAGSKREAPWQLKLFQQYSMGFHDVSVRDGLCIWLAFGFFRPPLRKFDSAASKHLAEAEI